MAQKPTVVVTGSTGKPGGAVARGLLERGHKVRAVTRNPNSRQAKLLANAGATLAAASPEDNHGDYESARRSDLSVRDDGAGWRASRLHFRWLRQPTDWHPALRQQVRVEKHIAKVGVRATILAPVSFMESLYFVKEQLAKGIYAAALPPTGALGQVAVAKIEAVAGRFIGKRIDLASNELTGSDTLAILSRVTGRSFTYF